MSAPPAQMALPGRAFAWGGALLFAASLGYFLFTYAFTFGETGPPGTAATAILWNVALFSVFGLHHSVFARERVRALVARTVPAPLERSFYVWVASVLLIAVCALWRPVSGVAWSVPSPAGWLLYLPMAAGVWLSIRSAGVIDVWELSGVRQARSVTGDVRSPEPAAGAAGESRSSFKTTGPYGLVRHPIYLGWFLMVFGVPVMTGTRLTFAIISCAYLLIAIPLEERTLQRTSGGGYDDYIKAVRWKLVPGIY